MNIYETISKVMDDIGAVGKNSKNAQQGFMFRGIDAVMNAINPALVKNKCFLVPEVLEQTREKVTSVKKDTYGNEKTSNLFYSICKVKYKIYAEDGTFIETTVVGEGMDSGDKATNKAMSIAFKYACFQVFCIPTEEMAEPDAECHEIKPSEDTIANGKITAIQAKALASRCEKEKVPVDTILGLYKVAAIDELTMRQYANVNSNWEKILAKVNS